MAHEHFCPSCFSEIPASASVCAVCGECIATLSERDYTVKLVHALGHPLADVRMRAIISLGLRRDATAVAALADCALRHSVDVVEGVEIINSLRAMSEQGSSVSALEELAGNHPAHAVRQAAAEIVNMSPRHGTAYDCQSQ